MIAMIAMIAITIAIAIATEVFVPGRTFLPSTSLALVGGLSWDFSLLLGTATKVVPVSPFL